jgi:hypothetical protein
MATDQNIGQICLNKIASIWQVDDAAIEWVERGFDWRPGSHLVRVRALPNEKPGTQDRWRVSVETDFLASVSIKDAKFINLVASSSWMTSTYSIQYPPTKILKKWEYSDSDETKLSLFSSVYVSPEMVQWLPQFFARAALIQVTNAEIQSVALSEVLGGKPDFLPSGRNNSPDDMLKVVNEVYAPKGKNRSRWHDTEEFVKFAETYGRSDECFGIGDKSGLNLETPFGDYSALIRLRSEVEHPQLGSGLLVTVQIPFTAEEISTEVAWLNFLEARSWTDFPQLGCWQNNLHDEEANKGLVHVSFVPNAFYADGLATNFAHWSVARARWLRQTRWPNLEDKPMIEILKNRKRDPARLKFRP